MDETMVNQRLYSLEDAMSYLGGITKPTLYELINTGQLRRVKIGRRSFMTVESLDAYIDARLVDRSSTVTLRQAATNPHYTPIEPAENLVDWFHRHWCKFKDSDGNHSWPLPGDWQVFIVAIANDGLPLPLIAYLTTICFSYYDGPDWWEAFTTAANERLLDLSIEE